MKQTVAAPGFAHYPDDWHFSPVLISGDFAFFSGQTGTHADSTLSPDPEHQFRDAFSFLADNLSAAELGFHGIVEMTIRRGRPSASASSSRPARSLKSASSRGAGNSDRALITRSRPTGFMHQ